MLNLNRVLIGSALTLSTTIFIFGTVHAEQATYGAQFINDSPLLQQAQGVTRDKDNKDMVTQYSLGSIDAWAGGRALIFALKTLRPDFKAIAEKKKELSAKQVELNTIETKLNLVNSDQFSLNDTEAHIKAIGEAKAKVTALEQELANLKQTSGLVTEEGAVQKGSAKVDLEFNNEARIRIAVIESDELPRAQAELRLANDAALPLSKTEAVSRLTEYQKQAKADLVRIKKSLSSIRGGLITRAFRNGIRVVSGATGLVLIADLGSRIALINVEGVDPGVFPVAEVAALGIESPEARQNFIDKVNEIALDMIERADNTYRRFTN